MTPHVPHSLSTSGRGEKGARTRARTRVAIYSKPDCCLCDEAKAVIESVRARHAFDVEEIDISLDPALQARFGQEIPVVFIAGKKAFKFRLDATALLRRLNQS